MLKVLFKLYNVIKIKGIPIIVTGIIGYVFSRYMQSHKNLGVCLTYTQVLSWHMQFWKEECISNIIVIKQLLYIFQKNNIAWNSI